MNNTDSRSFTVPTSPIHSAFSILDQVKPCPGIEDCELDALLSRFSGSLDSCYYCNLKHGTVEVEDRRYLVQFIESDAGYYMTAIDKARKLVRSVFVSLVRGDWMVDHAFFSNTQNLHYLLSFNDLTKEFVKRNEKLLSSSPTPPPAA